MVTPLQMLRDWRARRRHRAAISRVDSMERKAAAVFVYRRAIDLKTREIDRMLRIELKRRKARAAAR